MNIHDFAARKQARDKISMVTCYDYTSALIVAASDVDCILVGDSLAMTMHGYATTVSATTDMIVAHIRAVRRANASLALKDQKFIVGDMPFLSHRKSTESAVEAACILMQAGAHGIKIEGATGNLELIAHLVNSGVPVMGHLGLTPQSVNQLGGYKVQGKTPEDYQGMIRDAEALADAGAFGIVLECVPKALAAEISAAIDIPTIGIGAGDGCDGQVLVWQDMLGMNTQFKPKFVRAYMDGFSQIKDALNAYHADVRSGAFPNDKESYL